MTRGVVTWRRLAALQWPGAAGWAPFGTRGAVIDGGAVQLRRAAQAHPELEATIRRQVCAVCTAHALNCTLLAAGCPACGHGFSK